MIFFTVGTQLPFDRLTRAVDEWCAETSADLPVFGQVGCLGPNSYRPASFTFEERITPQEFVAKAKQATVIVSHAGMGTIITSLTLSKPLVVLARRAQYGEQRNDHQVATVRHLGQRSGLTIAASEADIPKILDRLVAQDRQDAAADALPTYADERLIASLRDFIHDGHRGARETRASDAAPPARSGHARRQRS
ncbi:glycosyltransferase [Rhodosalinus sp. FB01]|uniref:glycosyltransferase n=1 Tax=Rhodosalinus sp. FB01 TaxID=3239194 RepID=UPI00352469A1